MSAKFFSLQVRLPHRWWQVCFCQSICAAQLHWLWGHDKAAVDASPSSKDMANFSNFVTFISQSRIDFFYMMNFEFWARRMLPYALANRSSCESFCLQNLYRDKQTSWKNVLASSRLPQITFHLDVLCPDKFVRAAANGGCFRGNFWERYNTSGSWIAALYIMQNPAFCEKKLRESNVPPVRTAYAQGPGASSATTKTEAVSKESANARSSILAWGSHRTAPWRNDALSLYSIEALSPSTDQNRPRLPWKHSFCRSLSFSVSNLSSVLL